LLTYFNTCNLNKIGVADIGAYPDFVGNKTVQGTVSAFHDGSGSRYRVKLSGLEPNSAGGWHVHTGTSCAVASEVGGHYFSTINNASDPWANVKWASDENGDVEEKLNFRHFESPVLNHAVVIHREDGVRIGCGVITYTCNPSFNSEETFALPER
jgi:hypothetical protein